MEEKIIVSTNVGDIIAYPNADPTHPGISIMLRQKSSGYEVDLVYIEAREDVDDSDYDPDNLHVFCYEDVYIEDYTHEFVIRKQDVNEALGD